MASIFSFSRLGLGRTLSVLRQNANASAFKPVVQCTRPRSLMTSSTGIVLPQCKPSATPSLQSSRILRLLLNERKSSPFSTPSQRSFFSSSKQSLRYHPPPHRPQSREFLGFLDNIPHGLVLYTIIGLNAAVFGMWLMTRQKYKLEGDPGPLIWMHQNFLSSWANMKAGRVWTAITSCFSHQDWGHILFNGFTFFFMAPAVLNLVNSRRFIFLYLGAGLVSCSISLLYGHYVDRHDRPSQGASGAIYGVVTFLACVAPTLTFQLYGIIPVPAWLLVTGAFSYDLYSTWADKRGTTDTVGHIGGMLSGVLYYILLRRAGKRFTY